LIPVRLVQEVLDEDLPQLPSDRLRQVAMEWLIRLRREPHLGQRLQWRRGQDLSSCRKLYFDEKDEPRKENFTFAPRPGGPRFRIVYQLLPRPEQPELVRVLAIGPKYPDEGENVYGSASTRL
jgi:hypothetical protein